MASTKNFIIHTTDERYKSLLTRLLNQGDYKRYYDGHEHTTRNAAVMGTDPRSTEPPPAGILSTRYYFYDVPQGALTRMVRHLQNVKTRMNLVVKVKIGQQIGNFNWD